MVYCGFKCPVGPVNTPPFRFGPANDQWSRNVVLNEEGIRQMKMEAYLARKSSSVIQNLPVALSVEVQFNNVLTKAPPLAFHRCEIGLQSSGRMGQGWSTLGFMDCVYHMGGSKSQGFLPHGLRIKIISTFL